MRLVLPLAIVITLTLGVQGKTIQISSFSNGGLWLTHWHLIIQGGKGGSQLTDHANILSFITDHGKKSHMPNPFVVFFGKIYFFLFFWSIRRTFVQNRENTLCFFVFNHKSRYKFQSYNVSRLFHYANNVSRRSLPSRITAILLVS